MAIYRVARLIDDLGDEAPGDRMTLLDQVEQDLARADGAPTIPAVRALMPTIRSIDLPIEPFHRLIEANRMDQRVTRYRCIDDLLAYCALSANPIGHLVLHVFRAATPERVRLADAVCTALQLAEHWQDVAEDWDRGRVYLPQEDLDRFGCQERDLGRPTARPAVRALLAFEVERTAAILDVGAPLVATLQGTGRLAAAGYVAGGRATLDAIAAAGYDILSASPRPARGRVAYHAIRVLLRGR